MVNAKRTKQQPQEKVIDHEKTRAKQDLPEQKTLLRLRRFSQCPRRVCFALCDDYCERVFAPWQDCSAYELAQESGRCRGESSHS
jgi:hypothetical protein